MAQEKAPAKASPGKAPEKKAKKVAAYKPVAKSCPKCGARLADHKDRYACGKCGYTEWKSTK